MYLRCLRSFAFLSIVFVLTQGFSQTFAPAKLSPLTGSSDSAAGDFNHDGLLDVVTVNSSTNQVALLLSNGDGTFRPGGVQTVAGASGLSRLVIGDFNHDGNLDVAVLDTATTNGGTAVYLLFGDGHGLLALPTGNYSTPATPNSITAGDFNNDGATDLAVLSQTADRSSATITLLINNGDGTFASSSITGLPLPFTTADPNFGESDSLGELVAGDFDGDGRMDLLYRDSCFGCDVSQEPLFLLKNIPSTTGTTPGAAFAPAQPHANFTGSRRLRVFDVDGDGRADIVTAYDGCHTPCVGIGIIYSNADGSTSEGGIVVSDEGTIPLDAVIGDFNNDGILDLAAPVTSGVSDDFSHQIPNGVGIWTGKGGRTSFPSAPAVGFNDPVYFPLADNANPFAIGAGFIDADHNKDIFTLNGDGTIAGFLNTTSNAGDPCPYPDQPGVNFCLPTDGSTTLHPTRIVASARGATQPVSRIEVWVDGHKQTQVFNDKLNTPVNLSLGPHTVDIVEVDATGAFLTARRSFTVGSETANECASPAAPGVHVCAPQPGSNSDSPVGFVATATAASGSVQKMQLRIDGQQVQEVPGDQINISLNLAAGFHEAIITEVDSSGASIDSVPIDFSVNGLQGSCPAPATSPSVRFCQPVDGGTFDDPVSYSVSANVPNLTLLRLYVNDQPEFETTQSFFTGRLGGRPAGQLRLVVVAYDSHGNSYTDRRTITFTGEQQGQCRVLLFPSVHICSPSNGSTTPSPVHVRATAEFDSLQLLRLYVDNTPVFETQSVSIDTTLNLPPGPHHLVVVAYSGNDQASTASVNTTVSGTMQSCAVPGANRTINICSPAAGTTVSSPVNITAQGRWDHFPIVHMRVYVDNHGAFDVNNPQDGYLNTQLALASGTHNIVIVAWDKQGDAITSAVRTVQVP